MSKLLPILLIIMLPDLSNAYGPDQGEAGVPLIAPGKTNLPEPIGILLGLLVILFFLYIFVSGIPELIKEDPAGVITFVIGLFLLITVGLDIIKLMAEKFGDYSWLGFILFLYLYFYLGYKLYSVIHDKLKKE